MVKKKEKQIVIRTVQVRYFCVVPRGKERLEGREGWMGGSGRHVPSVLTLRLLTAFCRQTGGGSYAGEIEVNGIISGAPTAARIL
jgi:hypothetical protein